VDQEIREVGYLDSSGLHVIPVELLLGVEEAKVLLHPGPALSVEVRAKGQTLRFRAGKREVLTFGITCLLLYIRQALETLKGVSGQECSQGKQQKREEVVG